MKAIQLKCSYLNQPIGIEEPHPNLTWKAAEGKIQTAYEICTCLNGKEGWGSGKIETSSMNAIYGGNVKSRDIVTWKVRLYDENGQPGDWSEEHSFEMGLLGKEEWIAKWITGKDTDKNERLSADYYRKRIMVSPKIKIARLYATACGIYEAFIDGKKVGNQILAPGCTEYEKRLYYQTYDVTEELRVTEKTEKKLEFIVGDGWYKGKIGFDSEEYYFGTQTKLFAQLEIIYENGSRETIGTDESFLWSNQGAAGYNDLKDGICFDMCKEADFSEHAVLSDYNVWPMGADFEPIKEQEHFTPQIITAPSGKEILDFGQNMAGYVICNIAGTRGQKIVIRMGEVLDNGEFTQDNIQTLPDRGKAIEQKIEITFDGIHVPVYPKFFYAGFRYAQIEGLEHVKPEDFTAVAIYSDIEYHGEFSCSNPMINQLVKNTIWSEKSNFIDIPTDCPQREKGGWTGDAHIFCRTAMYFSETAAFYRKWLRDVRDCQQENGLINMVCPRVFRSEEMLMANGSIAWGDAAVIIPYQLWKMYGDDSFIKENLQMMVGWKKSVIDRASDKSIYESTDDSWYTQLVKSFLLGESPYSKYIIETGMHFGEWIEPEGVVDVGPDIELCRPKQEEGLAYTHYTMRLMEEMMRAVGETDEAEECREYSEGAKAAYQYHFVKEDDIDTKRQAKLVRPIALGLLTEAQQKNVARRLNETAIERDYKVGTGFLSTPFVLQVLVDTGYTDTAYRMLENTEEPGWLSMVKQGATTIWESYNGYDKDGHPLHFSFNHYSPGAVCGFLFSYVAGMRLKGERKFLLKPYPGGSLRYTEAAWDSCYGMVKTKWSIKEGAFIYKVEIPPNCTAVIEMPDGRLYDVAAGNYRFLCDL